MSPETIIELEDRLIQIDDILLEGSGGMLYIRNIEISKEEVIRDLKRLRKLEEGKDDE